MKFPKMVVWVAVSRESNTELLLLAIRLHGELYAEKYSKVLLWNVDRMSWQGCIEERKKDRSCTLGLEMIKLLL